MQSIAVGRYPILLIDESQDTNKSLVEALFAVQRAQPQKFVLGLFGDTMQRIYNDGMDDLGANLPDGWAKPVKKLNYRCPNRVVTLINKVRSTADRQHQAPRSSAVGGFVRLYILPTEQANKLEAERAIALDMAQITGDEAWRNQTSIKTLTLEHRMAAKRMGFLDMFNPLYDEDSWRTSFLEGELPAARFFSRDVLALIKAKRDNDKFAVARIVKKLSPLLTATALKIVDDKQKHLKVVSDAIDKLLDLFSGNADPTLLQVLRTIADSNLLEIPESLQIHASAVLEQAAPEQPTDQAPDRQTDRVKAAESFLAAPFSQVEPFALYLSGMAHFDTHQGVKGLEFERVMVIMDDSEAKGFNFKYEKLFGGGPAGDRTTENTRRLFYVTCSRAEKSLALVAYSSDPERIRKFVIDEEWFAEEEVLNCP